MIEQNHNRLQKEVWTHNDVGDKIGASQHDRWRRRAICGQHDGDTVMNQHRPYDDFAVLYRTNAQSRSIEDALRKKDIPYRIYDDSSFYQQRNQGFDCLFTPDP